MNAKWSEGLMGLQNKTIYLPKGTRTIIMFKNDISTLQWLAWINRKPTPDNIVERSDIGGIKWQ